jgi:hypothetical protein
MVIFGFLYALCRGGLRILWPVDLPPPWLALILAHLVFSVPLFIALLVYRRRFLRWSMQRQRACATLAWCAVGVTILIAFVQGNSL